MTSFPVSDNVAKMKGSSTLIAAQAAADMQELGIDVIDLEDLQGPDLARRLKALSR